MSTFTRRRSRDYLIQDGKAFMPVHSAIRQDLNSIMPSIADLLRQAMTCDRVSIFVYGDDSHSTVARYRVGYAESDIPVRIWTDDADPTIFPAEAEVIRTRRPLQRCSPEDFLRFPMSMHGQERREGRLCDILLPLNWGEDIFGVAYLWRVDDPTLFTGEEIAGTEVITQMAAMAISSARQYADERTSRDRLDAMVTASNAVNEALSIEDALPLFCEQIRRAIDADVSFLYVFDESGDRVLLGHADGANTAEVEVFNESLAPYVSEVPIEVYMQSNPDPLLISDFDRWLNQADPIAVHARLTDIPEMLVAPVVYDGQLIGATYSWRRSPTRPFDAENLEFAQAISSHLAGVIERVRLDIRSRNQALETESLLRIGQLVLTGTSLETVLDEMAATLRHAIPYSSCYVALGPPEGPMRIVRFWGDFEESMAEIELPLDGSLSGEAVRRGEVMNIADVLAYPVIIPRHPDFVRRRAALVAPIRVDATTVGVVSIGDTEPGAYSTENERLFSLIAQQTALVLQRFNSRERLVLTARRQSFLASVAEQLIKESDPEAALPEIAQMACGLLTDGVIVGCAGWKFGEVRWVAIAHSDAETESRLRHDVHQLNLELLRGRIENLLTSDTEFIFGPDQVWNEHSFFREFLESFGIHQILAMPLFSRERGKGFVMFFLDDPARRFHPDDVETAKVVAQRLGDALGRREMNRNREALLQISDAMQRHIETIELVDVLIQQLHQIIPFDQVFLGQIDEAAREHRTLYYIDHNGVVNKELSLNLNLGVCGEAYRTKRAILDNFADRRPTVYYATSAEEDHYRRSGESVMVAPLITNDETLGILFVSRTGNRRFTSADFETFMLFAGLAAAALDRASLVQHSRQLYRASVEVLAAVVDAKDPTTLEHSRHVAHYSRAIAELLGFSQDDIERIELAGLMHDIGKLSIPDRVLQKPGRLSDEEFELIKTHPDRGAAILEQHPALAELVPLVRHHHERHDGRGYPNRLAGDDIPLGASIICVADSFDTITSERTYQAKRTIDDALDELERCAGTQFRPEIVEKFVSAVRSDRSLLVITAQSDASLIQLDD